MTQHKKYGSKIFATIFFAIAYLKLILLTLTLHAESMSQVLNLEYLGTLLTARAVGRVKHQAKTALEIGEEHTMTAIDKDWLLLLTPRTDDFTCIRLGKTYGIDAILET
jgi:hypothetical protein